MFGCAHVRVLVRMCADVMTEILTKPSKKQGRAPNQCVLCMDVRACSQACVLPSAVSTVLYQILPSSTLHLPESCCSLLLPLLLPFLLLLLLLLFFFFFSSVLFLHFLLLLLFFFSYFSSPPSSYSPPPSLPLPPLSSLFLPSTSPPSYPAPLPPSPLSPSSCPSSVTNNRADAMFLSAVQ